MPGGFFSQCACGDCDDVAGAMVRTRQPESWFSKSACDAVRQPASAWHDRHCVCEAERAYVVAKEKTSPQALVP